MVSLSINRFTVTTEVIETTDCLLDIVLRRGLSMSALLAGYQLLRMIQRQLGDRGCDDESSLEDDDDDVRHVLRTGWFACPRLSGAVVAIYDELVSSIIQVVNLFREGKCLKILGEYIASAPLTPLVKPGGGIRLIAVGTVWRSLVSKVSAVMIGHSLDGNLDDIQLGVGVSGGGEAILHVMNRLIEDHGNDVGLSMLLVDFKNAFNLVDREVMLQEVHIHCPAISHWGDPLGPLLFALVLHTLICKIRDSFSLSLQAWYLDDGTIVGDTLVVGKVLELIMEDGPCCGLHLNVDKTEVFGQRKILEAGSKVFPSNIARPLHGVKLLGRPASVDFDFSSELVMKRVAKTIGIMDAVAKINDPQCQLLLLRACTGISRLYFIMRTCSPRRIVTTSGPGFGDGNGDLPPYLFHLGGLASIQQLAPGSLRGIFMKIMLYHVPVLLVLNIGITLCVIPLSIFVFDRGFWLVKKSIGLGGGRHKPLRPADMLLYSWDEGLDVCVDLTRSSPLTQTGLTNFLPGRAVVDAAHRKQIKYEAKCAYIGYSFLPFSFFSFRELEKDAVTLLKRI
ncbi:hypothetical protein Tco_1123071 [Tanacetum coccineum]|uniref:Reverse transcriptase domain-containing protein n=1 Tax=Tanacetum coccineum TaxID=301880 RepID=A0ABQ5J2B0_9ASTR